MLYIWIAIAKFRFWASFRRNDVMPFAVQPAIHAFQGIGERAPDACFVGTYDRNIHPSRLARQDMLLRCAAEEMGLTAIDRNSKDYIELKKQGIKFYKTPDAILRAQLASWDKIIEKKGAENPLFKKVIESQKAYAARTTEWQNSYMVDFKMASSHYFGKGAKKA